MEHKEYEEVHAEDFKRFTQRPQRIIKTFCALCVFLGALCVNLLKFLCLNILQVFCVNLFITFWNRGSCRFRYDQILVSAWSVL